MPGYGMGIHIWSSFTSISGIRKRDGILTRDTFAKCDSSSIAYCTAYNAKTAENA